ncbi:translation initiation factor IF-2 N-terminal domain-containing protein [Bounagaea algeriensis]
MLNTDTPAGTPSGSSPTPARGDQGSQETAASAAAGEGTGQGTFELPPKLRVHALAKKLGTSSREVIRTLQGLDESVRSAQSNITREVALRVIEALFPDRVVAAEDGAEGDVSEGAEGVTGTSAAGASAEAGTAASGAVSANGTAAPKTPEQPAAEAAASSAAASSAAADTATTADAAAAPAEESAGSGEKEAAPPLTPVFAAPNATFLEPEPQQNRTAAAESAPAASGSEQRTTSDGSAAAADADGAPTHTAADETAADETAAEEAEDEAADRSGDDSEQGGNRRRRRRGRRGRGRGRGGENEQALQEQPAEGEEVGDSAGESQQGESQQQETTAAAEQGESQQQETTAAAEQGESEQDESGAGNRRRRRRRRRKSSGEEDSGSGGGSTREDDPPNTVVHVRESAEGRQESSENEVRSVKGSTRLEAKRQRRRDGRDAGRRRAPVLSESEFLARRESVDRQMVVRQQGEQTQIAVLEDDILVENFVTSSGSGSLVGNVYLGRVQNVLPSMEAAFVDIGRGRNAVLYAGEVDWDAAGLAGKARRIEQALQTGDNVLVQVTKDPMGHKGARLTTQISLPGRFLVYVPGGSATGISRKLPDNERKRLKDILKRIVPDDSGVIIRTASEGTSEEALDRDVRRLQAQWEVIKEKSEAKNTHAPQLLYEEPDLLIKVIRDLFTEDFSQLTVQGDQAWDTIEAYVQHVAPDLVSRLSKHVGKNDVFTERRINEQISKALDRKVWLPSGGYLVIDRTEAMTVIDVNTGKFTGSGGNLEETVTRNNLEAAEEVVRQLRLRDVGGIIVIDFIDMVLEANRDLVLRRLTECLGRDRTRHQVAEVTSLGLVQMTRKRVGTGLIEAYSSTCEHCRGRGLLVSTDSVHHQHHHGGDNGGRGRRRGKGQDETRSDAKGSDKGSDKGSEKGAGKGSDKAAEKSSDKGSAKGSDRSADSGDGKESSGEAEPQRVDAKAEGKPAEAAQDTAEQPTRSAGRRRNRRDKRGAQAREAGKETPSESAAESSPAEQSAPAAAETAAGAAGSSRAAAAPSASVNGPDGSAAASGRDAHVPAPTAEPSAATASTSVAAAGTGQEPSAESDASAASTNGSAAGGRGRRKATRSSGSTSASAQPVVVSKPAEPADGGTSGPVVEPEPEAQPVRRRRRASSRQSGPPQEN